MVCHAIIASRWLFSATVENVVGTAVPREEDAEEKKVAWALSTGDLLRIRWQRGLEFELETENSAESVSPTAN